MDVEVLGVSTDEYETQCRFAGSVGVPFPMIADHDKRIVSAYGIAWPIIGVARRVTVLIDRSGTVHDVFWHELQIDRHLRDVRESVERLCGRRG